MAVYKIKWDEGSSSRQTIQGGFLRSRRETSPNISMVDTLWPVVRLHMANEATGGEIFLQPLSSIREILEGAVLQKRRGGESEITMGRGSQTALYSLAIEYIPRLLSYMTHIKTSKPEMGVILLDILCYILLLEQGNLYPFLLTFSSSLLHLSCPEWPQASHEVASRLCHFVLPFCLHPNLLNPSSLSFPPMSMISTLIIVMDTCSARHQLLIMDTLMYLKRSVCRDILSIIAHGGTQSVVKSALKLLLHYWPPTSEFLLTVSLYGEWQTPECENPSCRRGNIQASTLCLDPTCVSQHKGRGDGAKLYMLLCHECHSVIHRTVADTDRNHPTIQIPSPLRDVKPNCEFQKMCSGKEKQVNRAEVTCYGDSCTAIQAGQPIRMCRDCHLKQHSPETGDPEHIYQVGPPNPWTSSDMKSNSTMLEAVAKLLQFSPSLHKTSAVPATTGRAAPHSLVEGFQKMHTLPYQLMVEGSREGIWLLTHYCTPSAPMSAGQYEWLVHLSALALNWLRLYHDILLQVEEEISSPPNEDSNSASPDVTEYLQYFSNYNDISKLVDPMLTMWLCEVAKTNGDCLVAALRPNPQSCAQVGKLWDKECDSILRYQSSLRSVYRLHQFYKSGHLPRGAFMAIFNKVMPDWLDLLVQLRTETGKMARLHSHYHRLLALPEPEGLEMVAFVWDRFRGESGASSREMQRALYWLQDLTRLKIGLPYIHHMFKSAMEKKKTIRRKLSDTREGDEVKKKVSVASSFDEEVRKISGDRGREESITSNASDSESALVSESYLGEADTQAIASLNSSLTRSILMLDIWLSQMKLGTHMLEYTSLKKLLVQMLELPWGSKHSYADHHETTNNCLLCKATALWFSLATQLLEESERQLEEDERMGGAEGFAGGNGQRLTRLQQQRISMKLALKKLRRLTHGETDPQPSLSSVTTVGSPGGKFGTFPRKRGGSEERGMSPGATSNKGKSPQPSDDITDFDREFPPAEVRSKMKKQPLRKMPSVQGDSTVMQPVLAALVEVVMKERGGQGAGLEETDTIYFVFQLCRDHLKPKLHPEATHKVVQCIMVLVRRCKVFQEVEETEAVKEAQALFRDVWKCLSSQSSYVARSCVALLLDCLKFLNEHELSRGVEKSTGWVTFRDGLKTEKFKTVEKFCLFLEFMLSPETELEWNDDSQTVISMQVTVAYSFCLAVQLVEDRTSTVATRAQYCLGNLSVATLKALRKFMKRLFLDHSSHRILTLHSLSLLNTSLPRLGLLTLGFVESLVSCLIPLSSAVSFSGSAVKLSGDQTNKKTQTPQESVGSELSGQTPKTSISSGIPSSPILPMTSPEEESELLQLSLALLLNYLANPESGAEETLRRIRLERGHRESNVEPEMKPAVLLQLPYLHLDPPSLRSNPVFHVFLDHIYPVLDHNPEFSSASAISFILSRLVTCTAPSGNEGFLQFLEPGCQQREGTRCDFSLGVLPPNLREPWLRVFYVILYKYVHTYQLGLSDVHHDIIFFTRCCLEIALNTIEASPHICPLLPTGTTHAVSPLRRHKQVESSLAGGSMAFSQDASLRAVPQTLREWDRARSSLSPVREESPSSPSQQPLPLSSLHKAVQPMASLDSVDSVGSIGSVFLRPGSIQKLHSGLCSVCGRVTNKFAEEVLTNCAIVVATCCHRLPTRVSGYIVSRIIPALSKIIESGRASSTWQVSSSEEQAPGSATAVASNLLKSIATQFADRRLFIFLFSYQYEGEGVAGGVAGGVAERVFSTLGSCLPPPPASGEGEGEGSEEESEGMNVTSPVTFFLQDAVNSHNFTQDVRPLSLVHLALYVEKNPLSLAHMFLNINLLDSFCKKLRTTALLREEKGVHAFLRFMIQMLVSAPENMPQSALRTPAVHSFTQSFTSCLEVILCSAPCPMAGLFQLASHWYKTFLASPRDANRLALLYVGQMRQALKLNHQATDILNSETLISLTQVLLLEESGYLSYVDSLAEERVYAPQLRDQFENRDLFLNAIQELQWDFVDAMLFLDASPHRLPDLYIHDLSRLKLLIAQLVSLRIQHGRPPVEQLRRVINGDLRPIILTRGRASHQRSIAVRWFDHLSSLHIFSWLLLGAMCHNAVHQVHSRDQGSVAGGDRCQVLGSLDASLEVITSSAVWLTRGAMQGISRTSESSGSHCQYLLFTFTAIWTHYMETWEPDCTTAIVQFWENFVSNMHDTLSTSDEKHLRNVMHNLNDRVIVPLKKCGFSSFTLLLPIWRKLSTQLAGQLQQVFPVVPDSLTPVTMDTWCRDMVFELVTMERENSPHLATTAL